MLSVNKGLFATEKLNIGLFHRSKSINILLISITSRGPIPNRLGKRPELTGGGLVRSAGGWSALKTLRKANVYIKGDERILGDSDFVEGTLKHLRPCKITFGMHFSPCANLFC